MRHIAILTGISALALSIGVANAGWGNNPPPAQGTKNVTVTR